MERPEQHEIDEIAQRIFKNAIPPGWPVRPQTPDYGIDYLVELGAERRLTGVTFAVQLKGTKRLKRSRGNVTFSIDTHHLAYYLDKCRPPVFLVLADTARAEGYWVFLQEYALTSLAGVNWRNQRTRTIRIPHANKLIDTAALEAAVTKADRFMAGLRPASIPAAMDADRRRYESLDPRFKVIVRAVDGVCTRELRVKEPVNFTMRITGPANGAPAQIHELFGLGLPIEFAPGALEIEGSPLLAQIASEAVKIHVQNRRNITLRLHTETEEGHESAAIEHIPGTLEGGHSQLRIEAELPNAPLRIGLIIDDPLRPSPPNPKATVSFKFQAWIGQYVLQLGYFDQMFGLFSAIQRGDRLRMACHVDGNLLASFCAGDSALLDFLCQIARSLTLILKARQIAKWCEVNPRLPETLTPELAAEITDLHWMLAPDTGHRSAAGMTVTTEMTRESAKRLVETHSTLSAGELILHRGDAPSQFMGEALKLEGTVFLMTHPRIETPLEQLRRLVSDERLESVQVCWIGTEHSEWIVKKQESLNGLGNGLPTMAQPSAES